VAISLLVVLVALGLLHFIPELARWRHYGWFRGWVARLGELSGASRILLTLLVPVLACLLIAGLLRSLPLGDLWWLIFALAVLLYSLGPRELESDLKAIARAEDDASRHAAAQALGEHGQSLPWEGQALVEAATYAALRRRFGVLLWFFILGPAGALLYRLAQNLGRDDRLVLDAHSRAGARYVANALDWVPAHLMVFTLALVGHWEAVIGAWRQWNRHAGRAGWYGAEPGFLGAAACADLQVEVIGGDGYAQDSSDPLAELKRIGHTLLRALIAWLAVVALIALASLV
jgi:AmpE protein